MKTETFHCVFKYCNACLVFKVHILAVFLKMCYSIRKNTRIMLSSRIHPCVDEMILDVFDNNDNDC